jgi:hypothetical protein
VWGNEGRVNVIADHQVLPLLDEERTDPLEGMGVVVFGLAAIAAMMLLGVLWLGLH